jgi:predicted glycoside hydrolase/deacetylase ChbG (UPF0249 family)
MTRIWLVADDYGIAKPVNGAIRDLIANNRLNATSVMVVAPGFDADEARLLQEAAASARHAAIGLHFTLTAPFKPLTQDYTPVKDGAFLSLGRTMAASLLGHLERMTIAAEVQAQIGAFKSAFGRAPDFIDGHQHVQLLAPVSDALLAVMKQEAPEAWVRQCGRIAGAAYGDRKAMLLDFLSGRFRKRAARFGVKTNAAFAGTYNFDQNAEFASLFPKFLQGMPERGLIMCHPGVVDSALIALDSLTTLREREYGYFKSDAFPAALADNGVTLL